MGGILIANPGSSSRKYALFDHTLKKIAALHIEITDGSLAGSLNVGDDRKTLDLPFDTLGDAAAHVERLFRQHGALDDETRIEKIGVRIVAPGSFFLSHRPVDDELLGTLRQAARQAPLHVAATLGEIELLRKSLPNIPIVGVSDSAFHAKKPTYAWNYAINIHDADRFDIKRFGYHGISASACIDTLWNAGKLPPRVVICHLGSGSSITAVYHGRSIDTTMGYSPNEGVVMATRSGTINSDAVEALQRHLDLNDEQMTDYLNKQSGLAGIGGSNDIRELLRREADGEHLPHLALTTLVHSLHKAIGSMIVALNGCDMLVFTGTVGERSAIIRKRIVAHLQCMDFILDGDRNEAVTAPTGMTYLNQRAKSRPIVVIPADEAREIARHTNKLAS